MKVKGIEDFEKTPTVNGKAVMAIDSTPASGQHAQWDGSKWIPVTPSAGSLPACTEVNGGSGTPATTTSTTHILASGMSITPPSGTYAVIWSASVSNTVAAAKTFIRVYSGGAAKSVEKGAERGDDSTDNIIGVTATAKVTVNGSQAIEGRYRAASGTAEIYERSLLIIEVAP